MMEEDVLLKRLALPLLGTTLMAAPALAQTNPPAGSPPAAGQSSTMSTGNFMTQMQPGHWRASKLEGLNVYNNNDEKIGDISELIVDNSGKIQAVVVGVGGFLGIGERDVAIPFEQIRFVNEPRATATTATTGTTGATGTAAGPTGTTAPSGTVAAPTSPNAPATATAPATAPATTGAAPAGQTAAGAAARTGPDHAVLTTNMTKDQLRAVPEFRYTR
jgi:sporulation protein YlmC with PRC-barrel domain